jgi:hypothetical protein
MQRERTWVDRNPDPGEPPPKPEATEPTRAEDFSAWWQACARWNSYVIAKRRYDLAYAVDRLAAKERDGLLTVVETAVVTMAAMVLDGSLPTAAIPYDLWRLTK